MTPLLGEERHWSQELSSGEQQRLGFARAILLAPERLFCDEASSALDEASQMELYGLLTRRLPQTAIVSIAHRTSLAALHHRTLRFVAQAATTPEPAAEPVYHLEAAPA